MKNLRYQNATAWMIRRDGTAFPVIQHIYANPFEIEETLFAAEWLYGHTGCEQTKRGVAALVCAWMMQYSMADGRDVRTKVCQEIERRPYVFLTKEFACRMADQWMPVFGAGNAVDIERCCRKAVIDLNEEFLRARFGGIYHTMQGNRKLYFRISSENFNWSSVITDFLKKSQLDYEEFHVVIDEESVGINPNISKQSEFLMEWQAVGDRTREQKDFQIH